MANVGTVYAKALFELAGEKGSQEEVGKQLRSFWDTCRSSPSLMAALTGPTVDARSRLAILGDVNAAIGTTGLAKNLLEMLSQRGRLGYLPEVMEEYAAMAEAAQGVLVGQLRSAVELSSDEVGVLSSSIAKRVGSRVRLTQVVDPELLGGVVATVGGRTFDASLRTQMERFKRELI